MNIERKKASDFPQELLDLLDSYVHGAIGRREFMNGAQKFAVGGVTAAALFEMLKPNYALAIQVQENDARIRTSTVSVPSPQGNGSINCYLARPASGAARLPGILVVHENRGLNPYVKDVARRLATVGYMALAPDGLSSVGGYPGDDEKGGQLFGTVDRAKMQEDMIAAALYLKNRPDSTGKIGGTGFCYGGGVINQVAVRLGADFAAGAPYYGAAPAAADVPKIKAAMLVFHGEADTRLAGAWPDYDAALKAANVVHEGHIYPKAQHGFHNDTTPRYDEAAAKDSWTRAVAWFDKYVKA
jgi:carboxymethylenebutenolidase